MKHVVALGVFIEEELLQISAGSLELTLLNKKALD